MPALSEQRVSLLFEIFFVADLESKRDRIAPCVKYSKITLSIFALSASPLELCSRHCLLFNTSPNDSEQHARNDSNRSQEGFVEIKLTYHRQLWRAGCVFSL